MSLSGTSAAAAAAARGNASRAPPAAPRRSRAARFICNTEAAQSTEGRTISTPGNKVDCYA